MDDNAARGFRTYGPGDEFNIESIEFETEDRVIVRDCLYSNTNTISVDTGEIGGAEEVYFLLDFVYVRVDGSWKATDLLAVGDSECEPTTQS